MKVERRGALEAVNLLSISRLHFYLLRQLLGYSYPTETRNPGLLEAVKDMASVTTDYISVGGNRHPGAADWDVSSGVLAFGADNNVALWEPLVSFSP